MAVALYVGTTYPDVRGMKWITTLRASGFDVVVLRGRGHKSVGDLWPSGSAAGTIETIERLDTKVPISVALARRLAKRIASYQPDIILVRDIFLAGYVVHAGRKLNVPCYVDVADNYPEVIKSIAHSSLGKNIGFHLLNQWERHVLRNASGVIVVSPESREYIIRKHELPRSRMFVVENVPLQPKTVRQAKSSFAGRIVYIGSFDRGIRDLDTVIGGLEEYRRITGERVGLSIYAFAPDEVRSALLCRTDHAELVTVMPAVRNEVLDETLQMFDAGVVPHCRCSATEYTVPNKLFDYLYSGIRVMCSDIPPLKRVVDDTGGGVTYSCGDSLDFAQSLRRLKSQIENGRGEVRADLLASKYEWTTQVDPFVSHLHDTSMRNR